MVEHLLLYYQRSKLVVTDKDEKLKTQRALLRASMKQKLFDQQREDRLKKSDLIKERLFADVEFVDADVVMFYVSTDDEVYTVAMISETMQMGKKVAVPVTFVREKKMVASLIENFENDLEKGPYGILQPVDSAIRPVDSKDIDLVVVPGVAFDKTGNRIGRGAGYYDRFLSGIPSETPVVGLAFDFQIIEELPVLPHDVPVKKVFSA